MSIFDPFITPNYQGWAKSPVLSIQIGLDLLVRYAVDAQGWSTGEEFETKIKCKKDEIHKAFFGACSAGKIEAEIHKFKDCHYGELMDYANSQIEKSVLLHWAKNEGMTIPEELEIHSSKYQSTSDVANSRWAPKNHEEKAIKDYVTKLLISGCSCDSQQMYEIVNNANDNKGKMLFPLNHLSEDGAKKVISQTFRRHYGDNADKKIRGCKGFFRSNDCSIHK